MKEKITSVASLSTVQKEEVKRVILVNTVKLSSCYCYYLSSLISFIIPQSFQEYLDVEQIRELANP